MIAKDRLIVALDVDSEKRAMRLAEELKGEVRLFKVGLELFSSCGPQIVGSLKKNGCEVFLDLKFHDIPNTVSKAAVSVTRLGLHMFTLHALGGYEMMKRTAEAVAQEAERLGVERPKILAVTILTSMNKKALRETGLDANVKKEVLRLAELARDAWVDGVVASPKEARDLRKALGKDFLIVTPGVRPSWAVSNDQKRAATPKEAIRSGADYIVVGRPIIDAEDPESRARAIIEEMER